MTIRKIFNNEIQINYDLSEWITVESENYKLDRDTYIIESFYKDYPKYKGAVRDYEMLMSLCTRSTILGEWLIGINAKYVLEVNIPKYLENLIEPKQYNDVQYNLKKFNDTNKNFSDDCVKLSDKYKNDLETLRNKYSAEFDKFKKDQILRVLTLKTSELPIEIQLEIENFTPAKFSGSVDSKTFSRELLIQYKRYLLKEIKNNPKIDINDVISNNQTL